MEPFAPAMEQRRFARTSIEVPVVVRGMASPRTLLRGHCLDLSEGGTGSILPGDLKPGQVVLMELILAPDHPVQVNARVRHSYHLHCGFEFLAPEQDVIDYIRTACARA